MDEFMGFVVGIVAFILMVCLAVVCIAMTVNVVQAIW